VLAGAGAEWWTAWCTFLCTTVLWTGSALTAVVSLATVVFVAPVRAAVLWEALAPPHPATTRVAAPINSVRLTYLIPS
jgi:hypothetical protein